MKKSKNYRKTKGILRNHYRDEPSNPLSSNSECFEYTASITRNTSNVNEKTTDAGGNEINNLDYYTTKVGRNDTEVVIPLKHLSNFWRSLNIPKINCEAKLILTWSKNCVLADMTGKNAEGTNPVIARPLTLEFKITDTKLYFPVVTLSK